MSIAVQLKVVAPVLIAAVRRQTTFAEVPRVLIAGLDVVWAAVRSNSMQHGHNVAVYRPLGGEAVDLVCGVQVAARFDDEGEVSCSETPAGNVATATHVGPYDRLGDAYDTVVAWTRQNGLRLAGVNWEVYGDWHEDPAKLETDVYMLIEPD
jgi:effector-binding domain-containing protein